MELTLDKVCKSYDGKRNVLQNISNSLSKGIYGILGENGVGKSTLMRIVTTVDKASQGNIYYNGESVLKMGERYRDILGYLPQNFEVYDNFTGEDYLTYISILKGMSKGEIRRKVDDMLKFVNLFEHRKEKVVNYSGGMKRRIGIAQAILNDPEILILDEPTAGLDPVERLRFYKLVSYMSSNRIVILSTHIVADIEAITDNVIIMKGGKIVENGKKSNLLEKLNGKVYESEVNEGDSFNKLLKNENILKIHMGESANRIRYLVLNGEELLLPGVDNISLVSKFGKNRWVISKYMSRLIYIAAVFTAYYLIVFFITAFLNGGVNGLRTSIQLYESASLLNITLGEALILLFILGFIGVLLFSQLVMSVSMISKSMKLTLGGTGLFLLWLNQIVGLSDVNVVGRAQLFFLRWNPLRYIHTMDLFFGSVHYFFLGVPVSYIVVIITIFVIFSVINYFFIWSLGKRYFMG